MKRIRVLKRTPLVATALLLGGALVYSPVSADTVSDARGSAFGLELKGPVPISARPSVEAVVPPGPDAHAEDSILEVPADPLATSFTAHVQADASVESTIEATLQATMDENAGGLPTKWNGRGYAITEDLEALADQLTADVIESEAVAGCVGGDEVLGAGARILNLSLGGQAIPIINPDPNQVVFNQAGITITFFETNWDPAAGATTDGSQTVFVNALHVTAPGGIDLVVSHSEATADCAAVGGGRNPRGPAECEDERDNDGDGKIDFPADPGCESPSDDSEIDYECSDKIDNDGDGKIDFPADPGCESPKDDSELDAARGPAAPPAEAIEAQPAFTG